MHKKVARIACLLLMVVLVAAGSAAAGCGGGGEGRVEIVLGWLGDWTGPAAFGAAEYGGGLVDYLRTVEEENPIPGVKLTLKS
ncbi:MAG: hypothetical protein NTU41_12870, partial [Chloroflexi bacterium]|nr:hypothetical protein [Chloroflexota bacterium]